MTTAIIGTGGIGSAIARQLGAGGETLQFSSADKESARKLAAAIGGAAVVALRFSLLKDFIDEMADALGDTSVVVPSKVRPTPCDSERLGSNHARLTRPNRNLLR
jgi:8-hydroxy-5-deazaflavin:NADPH oxidoreductase